MSGVFRSIGKLIGGLLGTQQESSAQADAIGRQTQAALAQARETAQQTQALEAQNQEIARQTEQSRLANQQQLEALRQQQETARLQLQNERELADVNADKGVTNIEVGGTAAEEDPKKKRARGAGSLAATLGLGV